MTKAPLFLFAISSFVVAGCHHGSATGDDTTPPSEAGRVGTFQPFPALAPDVPQVVTLGGPVMDTPQVVAITFPNEGMLSDIETFTSTIGATDYWSQATSEYGVGPITALTPIHLTEDAPAMIEDGQIQAWLLDKLDGTHPEFPAPSVNVVYALFYPAGTTISEGGANSCSAFGGYHNSTSIPATGTPVVYAVLPRCTYPGMTVLDNLTAAASHELAEAATDPQPLDNPAYVQVDDGHAAYARLTGGGGEVGDMCEDNLNADYTPDTFPYMVQRIWSNASAAAGNAPCVPAPTDAPYFNSTVVTPPDQIPYTTFMGDVMTEGWIVPVGSSKTITFEIYSSAPVDQPITLSTIDLTSRGGHPGTLQLTLDSTTGVNGQRVNVTVTPTAPSSSRSGVSTFEVVTKSGTDSHGVIGVIAAQ